MNLMDYLPLAEVLVNELSEEINYNRMTLMEVEEKILSFVYRLGHFMVEKVIENIKEPTIENKIEVDGKVAYYRDMQNLRFTSRFGKKIIRSRRAYKIKGEKGGYYPLDNKLGLNHCLSFSPLLTYLISYFGGSEPYNTSAKKLSKALGFPISTTAVEWNTERTGARLEQKPIKIIPTEKQNQECDVMIVEMDGTTSPRIKEEEGIVGRESMKMPTEYKECNIVVIEKWKDNALIDRWTGAKYGPREEFEEYIRQAGLKMGQLKAEEVVFVSDGARHNWNIQITNFPYATAILDIYHALEHLSSFCNLFHSEKKSHRMYQKWKNMLYEGEILQVISEMNSCVELTSNHDQAIKEINYFQNNKERMDYKEYKRKKYPIGSGLVEGACKFVVGKRFKGSGMRWKKASNEYTLNVRLAILNNTLDKAFIPDAMKRVA